MTDLQGSLFGMPEPAKTRMEQAVDATIAALSEQGLLTPAHEARVQLARELARTIGNGAATAKTSVPLAAAQLNATLDALPQPRIDTGDPFEAEMRRIMEGAK